MYQLPSNFVEHSLNIPCSMTSHEFDECIDKLVARCSPHALAIYRAMGVIRRLMCEEERASKVHYLFYLNDSSKHLHFTIV